MLRQYLIILLLLAAALVPAWGVLAKSNVYVLEGTVVTPDHVIPNGRVLIEGQKIKDVGTKISVPAGVKVVRVDGLILPGMIDLHDHLTWNVFPRWKPHVLFRDRYGWQETEAYAKALRDPETDMMKAGFGCEMERYAEIKAIAGGATSVAGSLSPYPAGSHSNACIGGLARNLDFFSDLYTPGAADEEPLLYEVFPMEIPVHLADTIRSGMASGKITCLLVHLGEGDDASARREFKMLEARGLLRQGTVIIHGVALGESDFQAMSQNHVGLVWSPRSNFELYGSTTDVAAASAQNVSIAIGPDWSPTGSSGMLNELRYAAEWNHWQTPPVFTDQQLVQMVTTVPAELAHVETKIGSITPGLYADLIVLRSKRAAAYHSIVASGPADLKLVIVGGEPIYGDPALMSQLLPGQRPGSQKVCGQPRDLNLAGQGSGESLQSTEGKLIPELRKENSSLAPLQECP
ncbi:MAG: amidohydrolase family protein [Acidobacteriota bacterium]|nr:amidohydrolase family protein [Acidobacteriota bacterium]